MLEIADLSYAGSALPVKATYLAGWQLDQDMFPFFGHQLRCCPGTSHKLPAFANLHFNVMNDTAQWHTTHGEAVSRFDVHGITGHNGIANFYAAGGKYITFLTIQITQQGQVGGTIRIVFDCRNFGGDIHLVPLKIDNPVFPFVSPTNMSRGYTSVIVTTTRFCQRSYETFLWPLF
ncbi:MAG: hypothetical protein ACD_75C01726G0005 [uncultured bacterium]|nr:MAG: hypothetical protein ACD_75C01726G0005 [uncultured bacterium]